MKSKMTADQMSAFLTKHKLDVNQFARVLGITPNGVLHWVRGRREIPITIERLCRLFDKYPSLLLEFGVVG